MTGSEAGSYSRLIDFVYHSTLGLRVIKKKRRKGVPPVVDGQVAEAGVGVWRRGHMDPGWERRNSVSWR